MLGLLLGRILPSQEGGSESHESGDPAERKLASRVSRQGGGRVDSSARWMRRSSPSENTADLALDSGLPNPDQDGPLVVVPASLLGELSQAAGMRSLGQDLFSQDGKMEQYLQITDREKSAVQHAWRVSRKQVRALEARAARAEDLEDGSVRITVPDLSEGVVGLGRDFLTSITDTLGENRADVFLQMKQVDQIFAPSAGERVYQVKVESTGDGRWRYHMSYESPAGRKVWVGDSIPEEIRHITDASKIDPEMNPELDDEDEE